MLVDLPVSGISRICSVKQASALVLRIDNFWVHQGGFSSPLVSLWGMQL